MMSTATCEGLSPKCNPKCMKLLKEKHIPRDTRQLSAIYPSDRSAVISICNVNMLFLFYRLLQFICSISTIFSYGLVFCFLLLIFFNSSGRTDPPLLASLKKIIPCFSNQHQHETNFPTLFIFVLKIIVQRMHQRNFHHIDSYISL